MQADAMLGGGLATFVGYKQAIDESGLASSTGGRGRASTWQLQLSYRAVRASTDEQRTGYARGVAIVHPRHKMPRCVSGARAGADGKKNKNAFSPLIF